MKRLPRLLVTGASGFLGWHLCHQACDRYQVLGTYFTQSISSPRFTTEPLDLTDTATLQTRLEKLRPDAVIHTAAQSKPNTCQQHPAESYRINVAASEQLAYFCAQAAISLVFTSTDLVFDGQHAPYSETDTPQPVNLYGAQKVEAEQRILAAHPEAVVCRMPLMFGAATPTAQSFLQGCLSTLQTGKTLSLFTDEFRTPVSATDAAAGLLLAVTHPGSGIWHLGGPERLSRYEFGQRLVEQWKLNPICLKACRQADVPMAAPRPADVALSSQKAFQMGYQPQSIKGALRQLAAKG
ncbi:MAG: NAD(P)-dependent oxidoreductase [Cyanobacteria bacterium P01_A01_bin.114]